MDDLLFYYLILILGAKKIHFKSLKSVEVEDLISLALKFAPPQEFKMLITLY